MEDWISEERIRELALQLGLPLVGCAPAAAYPEVLPVLTRYYEEGRASGFEHPDAAGRVDPRSISSTAKTMVVAALPYRTEDSMRMRRPSGRRGMTSLYVWGEDYHIVLRDKLRLLAKHIEEEVGRALVTKVCVDTSPLVDRAVAVLAGIGWIGKNSCLITKEYGSWVFLGTLLLDLDVQTTEGRTRVVAEAEVHDVAHDVAEAPVLVEDTADVLAPVWLDECGECSLCLTACPTGALLEPYVLDSSSCLSYLTQSKGPLPVEYRRAMGKRLWGCDTCQTVCPKNKLTLLAVEERFAPDPELSFPDLLAVLTLSNRGFIRRFGHTAAAWRGATVWKRNALIALGNIRDQAAISVILPFLQDTRPELRSSAAWALQQIAPTATRAAVRTALSIESDAQVRADMKWAAEG